MPISTLLSLGVSNSDLQLAEIMSEKSSRNLRVARPVPADSRIPRCASNYAAALGAEEIELPELNLGSITNTMIGDLSRIVPSFAVEDKYDAFLIDDPTVLYAAPVLKQRTSAPIIFYFCDNRLFGLESYNFGRDRIFKSYIRKLNRSLETLLLRYLVANYTDAVIAISQDVANLASTLTPSGHPVYVVEGHILSSIYEDLHDSKPSFSTPSAISVARGIDAKGIDRLVDVWPDVRDAVPNAQLEIVGPDHPPEYDAVPGVKRSGFVPHNEIPDYLGDKALFVNPARRDVFPMAVLEAMAAGLPSLVTKSTGTYPAVQRVNPSLVVESDSPSIKQGIIRYFQANSDVQQEFSARARQIGHNYNQDHKIEEFLRTFYKIIESIVE